MMKIDQVRSYLHSYISTSADKSQIFFKTGKGEYAEGDVFIGVKVPDVRIVAKKCGNVTLDELQCLISSTINEERLLALFILIEQYKGADDQHKEVIYQFYLKNVPYVNNWNLVDASAHLIIGAHLKNRDRNLLINLASSDILWERRIAVVATLYFIRNNDLEWTFKIAQILLTDKHDLIHKAVGWMLREAGKRNESTLISFLDQHALHMPRTMLRYSIEKFPESLRKSYLKITAVKLI